MLRPSRGVREGTSSSWVDKDVIYIFYRIYNVEE
jgi:hypothetical protein